MNFGRFALRQLGWPRDGWRLAISCGLSIVAAWAVGSGRAPVFLALAIFCVGLAGLISVLTRQAEAERLAARLCGPDGAKRLPISTALTLLSSRLDALSHRLTNLNPVTGLPTRERVLTEIAADLDAGRGPRLLGAIRLVDFDRLAAFDQAAASRVLEAFAARLVGAARAGHTLAQTDRDCFVIWFRTDADTATGEFRALVHVASQDLQHEGNTVSPTIEAGAVIGSAESADPAKLLLEVTATLARPDFSAAGTGAVANRSSAEAARDRFALEQDLSQAIGKGQLSVVFQPVVDLDAGRLVGAEALLRWNHPTLGWVSPARFMPIVEEIGLSDRFGLWVLNAACSEARRWQDEGLVGLKVAVNLSAHQLRDPKLVAKIGRILDGAGVTPHALELELTETAAMADSERTFALFRDLRAAGISLAIDDFGTGYSSLSYLKNLPFDKLKIDREFVTDIQTRRDSQAICKALIELGKGLDLKVLAEGVETERELAILRAMGCSIFQGFYFSKPCSAEAFRRIAADPGRLPGLVAQPPFDFRPMEGSRSA